jgi:hypothetical protein
VCDTRSHILIAARSIISLPGWVAELQDSLVETVYDGIVVPAWDWAYEVRPLTESV